MFQNKPYTITVSGGDWFCAICTELACSGFGESVEEAIESCQICMRSILSLHLKVLKNELPETNIHSIANVVDETVKY